MAGPPYNREGAAGCLGGPIHLINLLVFTVPCEPAGVRRGTGDVTSHACEVTRWAGSDGVIRPPAARPGGTRRAQPGSASALDSTRCRSASTAPSAARAPIASIADQPARSATSPPTAGAAAPAAQFAVLDIAAAVNTSPFQLIASAAAGTRAAASSTPGPGRRTAESAKPAATATATIRSGPSLLPTRSDHAPFARRPAAPSTWVRPSSPPATAR